MKSFFIAVIFIFTSIFLGWEIYSRIDPAYTADTPHITINGRRIAVEIADEPAEYIQGLSYRQSLGADSGMLFIFPEKQVRRFWMKNMNFPIDIVWIEDDRIVNITPALAPEGSAPANTYSSDLPVDHVLEVNSGFAEKNKFKIGDKVIFDL
jgi:uncharacterized membrane protein (UPF0127 family)